MASATIIIPCYNEESRLDISAFRHFTSPFHRIAFLFVNDGSTDHTAGLLERLRTSQSSIVDIVQLERNAGKGEAVRQGVLASHKTSPDYVGFWDADLATPLPAILEFLDLMESRPELQVVMGSRVKLLGRKIERRAVRHYIGRGFATLVSIMLELAVYDTQCGAKLFRASPEINLLFAQPFTSRWIFDVEILERLIQSRRGTQLPQPENIIYEFPLTEWRDIADSKLTCGDFLCCAWDLLRIWAKRHSARSSSFS